MRMQALLAILAFAALPTPAAAQSAAWAQDRREPMCVYDGIVASIHGAPLEPSQMNDIRAQCRQRFGWTEAQVDRGLMVALIMTEMLQAQHDARDAGVDQSVIDQVRGTFNAADEASLGQPGEEITEAGNATIRRIAAQVLAHGLSGDAGRKATRAVLYQLMATRIIAGFAQEIMPPPAR